jgi:hypothetical protein
VANVNPRSAAARDTSDARAEGESARVMVKMRTTRRTRNTRRKAKAGTVPSLRGARCDRTTAMNVGMVVSRSMSEPNEKKKGQRSSDTHSRRSQCSAKKIDRPRSAYRKPRAIGSAETSAAPLAASATDLPTGTAYVDAM